MAMLDKQELEGIIARDVPGYRLAATHLTDRQIADPDAVGPRIEQLRRKYLGPAGDADAVAAQEGPEAGDDDGIEDQIVVVEPTEVDEANGGMTRRKTVVVSGRTKRVVGYQG